MDTYRLMTCRFCGKQEFDDSRMVKYGTRHYAHHACYLDAGKDLFKLSRYQVERFPAKLLKERGLLDEVERMARVGDLIGNW